MKAAIYVRISADREGRALGVQRQEADCRALAERLGWTVVEVYSDNDTSAFSGKPRPNYQRMLRDVRKGTVTAVLAYAPDRLYRRLVDLAEFIDTVTTTRCAVQTVAAGEFDLSTASGRQTAKLLGVIAEGESDRTGERIRRKLQERKEQHLPHGGRRPYGWEMDRVTIRESEAQWIRWGAKQTLGGIPVRAQFKELNEKGITNSTGGAWTHATYRGVLMTARHAGIMKDGSPACWPEIITPEQHRAVVRILSDPSRVTTPGRAGRLHLLSGIARCDVCGGPLRVGKCKTRRQQYPDYDVYRCFKAHISRHREHVEEFVRMVIAERLRRSDAALLLSRDEEEASVRAAASEKAARLRLLIDSAAEEHGKLGLPLSALAAYTAPLRAQLAAAEEAATPSRDRAAVFGEALDADDPGAAFLAFSVERQRVVVETLISLRIGKGPRGNTFRTDGIEITWN